MLEHLKQFILVQQEHFPIEHWSSSSTQLILVHQLDTIVFKLYSMKLHLVLFDISIFNHQMVVLQPPSALKVSFSSNDVHSFYFCDCSIGKWCFHAVCCKSSKCCSSWFRITNNSNIDIDI